MKAQAVRRPRRYLTTRARIRAWWRFEQGPLMVDAAFGGVLLLAWWLFCFGWPWLVGA